MTSPDGCEQARAGANPAAAEFDAYSTSYDGLVENSVAFSGLKRDFFVAAKIALLAELFAEHIDDRPLSLLDVGCGVGLMHSRLRGIVASLAGTDVSRRAIARAAQEHPEVEYRAFVGAALPWESHVFDVSLAVCVFHHVARRERAALMREMHRVARPGGLVVIIEHNPWNPLTRLAVARCPFDADAELLDARAGRLLMMMAAAFAQVHSRHFLMMPSAAGWSRRIEKRARSLPIGAQYALVGEV